MVKKDLLLVFIILLGLCKGFSQEVILIEDLDKKYRKKYEAALECYQKNHFDKAESRFLEVLKKYPNFYDARKSLSKSYLKRGKTQLALDELIKMDQLSRKIIFPLKMEIANLAERLNDYDTAIKHLESIIKSDHLKPKQKKRADYRYKELVFRKDAYAHPVKFIPESLSTNINTDDHEYLPAFNADASQLIYSKAFIKNGVVTSEDLYFTHRDSLNNFNVGMPIKELNTDQNEGAHSFSQDGRVIVFTACHRRDSYGGCDLYISIKKNELWSTPKNLGGVINSRNWDAQPCIANNNKSIIYSSTRPGGYGGSDLWRVDLKKDNSWSEPTNLGSVINTKGNEESPFLHADNQSFYFRSDGHIGMGDFDIFMSTQTEFNQWSTVKNIGYPINTKDNEGALFIELNGNTAYFASNALTSGKNLDILYFELPDNLKPDPVSYLKIFVSDAESGNPISATIDLTNISDSNNKFTVQSNANGEILTPLGIGNYAMSVEKDKYLFHSENIQIDSSRNSIKPYFYNIKLQKINEILNEDIIASTPIILNNIFFESGSAVLLKESNLEIDKLYQLLVKEEKLKIKIIGHTDNIGDKSDNIVLSEKRAKAVYSSLLDKGIEIFRIQYEGRGESEPIADNESAEGRKINRRTEFIIID